MRARASSTGSSAAPVPVCHGAREPLEQEPVLAHAQRSQGHVPLDDLAGARIDHPAAVGPAAGRAVDPLDDVVAGVQRVGAGRQLLHPVGVVEPGRVEGLLPPARAFDQGAPPAPAPRGRRRRRSAPSPRPRGRRVHASPAGGGRSSGAEGRVERRRVVDEVHGVRARPGVEAPRLVARLGKASGASGAGRARRRPGRRPSPLPQRPGLAGGRVGQEGLELQVVRESQAGVEVYRAPLRVEGVAPLRSGGASPRRRGRRAR
jgi:hypothetical protein